MPIRIISAGAGSGKTYRLTQEMTELLQKGVRANGIIATTFTNKAAEELRERVRVKLLEEGMRDKANDLSNALIGTVHSLGVKLLQRFAFEAGVSPDVSIIADEDMQMMFNQSLAMVLTQDRVEKMEFLNDKLGFSKKGYYDWRQEVKRIVDVARTNDFSINILNKSKTLSFETFKLFFEKISTKTETEFNDELKKNLEATITILKENDDETIKTKNVVKSLKELLFELKHRGFLYWYQWAKIYKAGVGAKSRDDYKPLRDFVATHENHPAFQKDIKNFIENLFDIAIDAIKEYENYKKKRGLIDYTDMEVLVKRLLDDGQVKKVLSEELDLLMVDEFQDTSPIQLEIFWKLSQFAKYSIWVGDPKQSIYGFRGADPELMMALIEKQGGIKNNDILKYSWRSREDIVNITNAIFTKAFPQIPAKQVILEPKRTKIATATSQNKDDESNKISLAIQHWHFQYSGEGRKPAKAWFEKAIAVAIKEAIEKPLYILPKGEKKIRPVIPRDFAILCRTNHEAKDLAEALHLAGLKSAVSRTGLLETTEIKLILACLRFILNKYDSLAIAEILLLTSDKNIESIIKDRLDFLENIENQRDIWQWAQDEQIIEQLNDFRKKVVELSSTEILDILIEEFDLRRIVVCWGKSNQRLGNIDQLRKLGFQYEERCNRLHTAASLGGFLLRLDDQKDNDEQASSENIDAVNVLTYHKSKGLEYPAVICYSLEKNLKSDVWGISIIPEKDEIDLNNILGNRWLRYWINPYADQYRMTPLESKINESESKKIATQTAMQEEARLLYVGITRARDYLIIPTREKAPKWLNRVFLGNDDYMVLDPKTEESPFEWNGKYMDIETKTFPFSEEIPQYIQGEKDIYFHKKSAGRKEFKPFLITPEKEKINIQTAKISKVFQYSIHHLDGNSPVIKKILDDFLTADVLHNSVAKRLTMATGIIERYDAKNEIEPEILLSISKSYNNILNENFDIRKVYKKYPLKYFTNNRLFDTTIDLLLETENRYIVIKNSSFSGNPQNQEKVIKKLANWFYFTKRGLEDVLGKKEIDIYVHFFFQGSLIRVK